MDLEEKKLIGFNKKRAEGRDKSGNPKTLQLKTRKLNPVSTICYVQVLGTGMDTQDTSPSVLLFFDKQRFIFNAGEGLQRFCTEHKIKLSKIDHMFLTRVCSETAGGLPGLLLTLAGIGEEGMSVNIWGPSDIKYLVDAMRSFIPNAAMVHTHSFGEAWSDDGVMSVPVVTSHQDPIILIDDEVVRVSAIPLRPYKGSDDVFSQSSLPFSTSGKPKSTHLSGSLKPCSEKSSSLSKSNLKPGDISVVYVCELPEIMGKFDPQKANSLGLRTGPKFRELQLGNSVMSDSLNILVHPSDVLGPSSPGPIILLVDCPTPLHMTDLFSNQSLDAYYVDSSQNSGRSLKSVNCIIHISPSTVTKSFEYRKWMKRFGNTKHIMAGHEMKNLEIPILKSSAKISSRLNYFCPQLFPASGFPSLKHYDQHEESSLTCETILAENLLKFHLRPISQLGLDRSAVPPSISSAEIVNELVSEIPEIADISSHVSQIWKSSVEDESVRILTGHAAMVEEPWIINESSCLPGSSVGVQENQVENSLDIPRCLRNVSKDDMEVVLLGTGSSQPSKYRNVSSVFVNLFAKGSLLLDCGEGTLAQLRRRFGTDGADKAVKNLKCIWISHIHADHHAGLARILALRFQLLKDIPHEQLLVVGPRPLKKILDAYSQLEELDVQFLDCRHTTKESINQILNQDDENNENSRNLKATSNLLIQSRTMQSFWRCLDGSTHSGAVLPVLKRLMEVLSESGLKSLFSVPVVHCPHAFGVVLEASGRRNAKGGDIPGWKLVYSGDTRPCQALIDASRDATLLIHEATFEDSLQDEAVTKNHSTTMEAFGVGASAGAYRIILTHFSQRYPKIPVFDESHMQNTCVAFDLMSVNLADLPVLPKIVPYLKVLFRNEMGINESDETLLSALCS